VRVYVAPAKEDEGKSAFIASKKLGNAIIRNRHKRRLKELFRLMRDTLKNRDFILVAKPALVTETFQESQRLLWNVFKELNVIKGEVNNANDSNRMH
jgi:ribonuclease P protein component